MERPRFMWFLPMLSAGLFSAAPPLELSRLENASQLPAVVWQQAPELAGARISVARALAERGKAERLPNPGLDLSVNTLPVGPLNPPGLSDPFLNVPNVAVGLSWLIELGKRGPRQEATAEAARAAALDALDQVRRKALELEDVIGDVAAAQVRLSALSTLTDDARRLSALQQARAEKGDTAELDADRARLELEATLTAQGEATELLAASLRQCGEVVGAPCVAFADLEQANRWLDHRCAGVDGPPTERPDLQALEASVRSARAAERLARATAIPDPTVRLGYVRDQFVVSGNQQNSLFVGVSVPLPLFERGQDDARAAAVAAAAGERAREQLLAMAHTQLAQLGQEAERVEARQKRLREQSLPLARSVVERLDLAVTRGAAPLQELLLARRTLAELLLTAAELDRTLFHLHVARARLSTSLAPFPELQP
ncbi:MAG: TolC family protein [Myxococcota bacterium]